MALQGICMMWMFQVLVVELLHMKLRVLQSALASRIM
jgi:hypothetical protein